MNLRTLADLPLEGKRVLLRVDFNVPLENGRIVDDTRIRESLPTFVELLRRDAAIVIVTHVGRPGGKVVEELSVAPLAVRLAELLARPVNVALPGLSHETEAIAHGMRPQSLVDSILMLENIRFEPGEETNDPELSRRLAALADVYVNDAFGTAHRAHASTEGVAHLLPSAAGLLMAKEVRVLSQVLTGAKQPMVAIVGGSKISSKIGVMEHLLPRVGALLVGGAMACTLIKARGGQVGASKVEEDQLAVAQRLLAEAGDKLRLPIDAVAAASFSENAERQVFPADAIPDGWLALDIGPATVRDFAGAIDQAGTVVWNGPLGVYEMAPFRAGTQGVAMALAQSPAYSVVGGGDLAAALAGLGLTGSVGHLSTGGGATLEFLEGRDLPGIRVLERKDEVVATSPRRRA